MKKDQLKEQFNRIKNNNDYLNFIRKNQMMIQKEKNKYIQKPIIINKQEESNIQIKKINIGNFNKQVTNSLRSRYQLNIDQVNPQLMASQTLIETIQDKYYNNTGSIVNKKNNRQQSTYNTLSQNKSQFSSMLKRRTANSQKKSSIPIQSVDISFKFPQLMSNKLKKLENNDQRNDNSLEKSPQSGETYKNKQMRSLQQGDIKNQKLLKTYYQYENLLNFRQQAYDLIPAFLPHNDFLKKVVKRGKRSKKIINNNDHITQRQKQLQSFLQSKIILKKSLNKLNLKGANFERIVEGVVEKNMQEGQQLLDISQQLKQTLQSPQTIEKSKKSMSPSKSMKPKRILSYNDKNDQLTIYQCKIRAYRQFLFLMNLAHRKFDPIQLKQDSKKQCKYKIYIGNGNNSMLIKSLIKRRFWWTIQEDYKKANFVWTQLKINQYYQYLPKAYLQNLYDKIQNQTIEKQQQKSKSPTKSTKANLKIPPKAGIYKAPLKKGCQKILTSLDLQYYQKFIGQVDLEKVSNFNNRLKYFPPNLLESRNIQKFQCKVHNHFQFNYFIGNKKALFYNLKQYYQLLGKNVFTIIPLTFHIQKGTSDPQYQTFLQQFNKIKNKINNKKSTDHSSDRIASKNVWIVKPGQLSNRGNGITVIDQIYQLNSILKKKQKHTNGLEKTYIVQKYIQKPMLYNRRKFDIRHYMMASRLHGRMRAYWFGQGYIRTSSAQYNIDQIDNQIMHLTNDAIQKYSQGYGKYQQGNKISYNQFQRYLNSNYPEKKYNFTEMIYPKMKQIALDAFKATYLKLDPNNYQHTFQIFGLDFMIDSNFNVWLIQVNTNPCLELSSNLLSRIIPTMVEHTFRLTLDVIYPPPAHYPNSQKYLAPDNALERLQFELIFDQARDGSIIQNLYKNAKNLQITNIDEEDETYDNQGKQIQFEVEID